MDGYSEIECLACGHRIGAWSEKVLKGTLKDGEHEAPYGETHRQGCKFAPRQLTVIQGGAS